MKAFYAAVTNVDERTKADECGLPVPEEVNEWGDCWFRESDLLGATDTEVFIDGEKQRGLKVFLPYGESFIIPDTPEYRQMLDKQFA